MASYITVSQLNNYLKRKFEADAHLGHVYLKGEISNSKLHSRGHLYFSLKDEESVISAIMFERDASKLNFEPKEGTKVFVEGKVTVYEGSGKYQIVVSSMQPDGIGELYIAYEKLKKQLEQEGLFKKELKKPIPKYPKKIGIVTAPTGAAIRDILSTIKRRFPIAETILFPALVQGENAKYSLVEQLEKSKGYDLDVLIVGRGGGSIEDLWAFNEEIVARAIFSMEVPVISAVGHEVDFTIADFVADLRAPTPTGAAELAVPNMVDVFKSIENLKIRLETNTANRIKLLEKKLDSLKNSYVLKNPMTIYEVKEQKLSGLMDKLESITISKLDVLGVRLNNLTSSYALKNPMVVYQVKNEKLKALKEKLKSILKNRLENSCNRLENLLSSYVLKNPLTFYEKERDRLESLSKMLTTSVEHSIKDKGKMYENLLDKLELLNPLGILKKGYSVVSINGKALSSHKKIKKGEKIDIRLHEGVLLATVDEVKEK